MEALASPPDAEVMLAAQKKWEQAIIRKIVELPRVETHTDIAHLCPEIERYRLATGRLPDDDRLPCAKCPKNLSAE
jgi:hypothetical protein